MKRAQVTIFVIIGIVAIILIAILLAAIRYRVDIEPIRTTPAEFEPIRQHVLNCVGLVGEDAIKEVASHGGYLDPLATDPPLILNEDEPVESDLVLFNSEDRRSAVPYYFYLRTPSTCNACTYAGAAPTREEVAENIAQYITDHLGECINFGVYPDFTIEPGERRDVSVTITNESVVVLLDWDVRMRHGSSSAAIEEFYKRIDVPLGRYLNVANELASNEAYYQYLENYLLYIITTYGGIGQPLPGITGFEESFAPSFWVRTNVERSFRQLLYALTPSLRVIGARDVSPPNATGDPHLDSFLRVTQLPAVLDTNISDLEINFHYFNQPIYLRVDPSKGELIRPRSEKVDGMLFIPPRQLNYYDFFYDVSAPFIVEIRDPQRDMSFLFALEANLRDNKNLIQWVTGKGTIPWDPDWLDFDLINQNVVGAAPPTGAVFRHNESVSTRLCEVRKADFTAQTWDAGHYVNGFPRPMRLENVTLSFRCGYLAECPLGRTRQGLYFAEWVGKLPPCEGGFVKAEKEGYLSTAVEVSTSARPGFPAIATPSRYTFNMYPFVNKRVRFEKYLLDARGRVKEGPLPLDDNDVVRVEFTRRQQRWGEDAYSTSLFSEHEDINVADFESWNDPGLQDTGFDLFRERFNSAPEAFTGRQEQEVSLVPGTYEVSVQYYDRDGQTIPNQCEEYCYCPCWSCSAPGFLGGCSKKCVQIPEDPLHIDFAPWGGLEMNEQTRLWVIRPGDLYKDSEIVIPVLVAEDVCCNGGEPTADCPGLKSLERMTKNEEYTRKNRLYPHFVST